MLRVGPGRQRERDRAAARARDVAGAADEERHAAQLLGAAEQRADVAAQPDPRVDEALEVRTLEVPERRAHHAFLDRDVHEQRVDPRIRTDARRAGRRR